MKIFIFVLIIFFLLIIIKKLFKRNLPTIEVFDGSLGNGKTLICVYSACREYKRSVHLWRRTCFKIWLYGLIHKISPIYPDKPLFLSNIPINLSKYDFAYEINDENIIKLTTHKLPVGSVVLLDEISQYQGFGKNDWKIFDVQYDSFIRYYRQDTKGGYLICNDQSIENICAGFRRRVNIVNKTIGCTWFLGFVFVRYQPFYINSDVLTPILDKKNKPIIKKRIFFMKKGVYNSYAHFDKIQSRETFKSRPFVNDDFNDNRSQKL